MANSGWLKLFLKNLLPFLRWGRDYNTTRLLDDSLAGASLASILIPQAMSYALLAMLPPVSGLYSTVFSALAHLLFGISPYQSNGPFALVSLMTGNAILSLAIGLDGDRSNDSTEPWEIYPILIPLSEILTVTVAIMLFLMLITRVGKSLKLLLNDPLIKGFTGAAALSIASSQAKLVFGIRLAPVTGTFIIVRTWIEICSEIQSFQPVTFLISISTILLIIMIEFLEKNWPSIWKSMLTRLSVLHTSSPTTTTQTSQSTQHLTVAIETQNNQPNRSAGLPKMLISLIVMTLISYWAEVNEKYSTDIVGVVSSGFPSLNSPFRIFDILHSKQISELLVGILFNSLSISLVTYVTLLSIVQTFPMAKAAKGTAPLQESPREPLQHDEVQESTEGAHRQVDQESVIVLIHEESRSNTHTPILKVWEEEDNELMALVVANALCACCSGFCASGSISRSSILATQTGSSSPLTNAIASIFVVLTVIFLTSLIYYVPQSCLAAVIILSLQSTIFKIPVDAKEYWRAAQEKNGWKEWSDWSLWVGTFVSVVLLDPCSGILIGMGCSSAWIILKSWKQMNF